MRFTLPRDVYHGKGALEALKSFKGKKAMIVVGGGSMKRFGFLQKAEAYLKEAGKMCIRDRSISYMHDRSNGLGGGFAGYGIYPEYKDQYAFHIFYDSNEARVETERFLDKHFDVVNLSRIPTRKHPNITNEPLIWRYFVNPLPTKLTESQLDEREFVAQCVININDKINGSYVFSSGKNMGVFKAVGYPEAVSYTHLILGLLSCYCCRNSFES